MSMSTVLKCRLIRKTTLGAVSLATLGAFGAAAIAQQPSPPSPGADTLKVSLSAQATRVTDVPLADLNLSTPDGMRVARERLHAMAQRICAELARNNDLSYRPNWAACVPDTIAGALAQAKVLAAEKETRTARRLAP
jgi:UrcA family protein